MSAAVEVRERSPLEQVLAEVRSEKFAAEVAKALPGGLLAERFVRVTVTAIQQTPELITVDRGSLWRAIIRCAQDGLMPDGREAAFTIFENRREGRKEAQYMPMVGGYRKIAANHGISLEAYVVHEHDLFDYQLGFEPRCDHKPPKLGEPRGALLGAYAVATDARGQKYLEVMDAAEIAEVRSVSRAKDSQFGPWKKWEPEMWRKSPCRRLFKSLPLGQLDEHEVAILRAADDEADLPVEPKMAVEEANLNASLAGRVPTNEGPVDQPALPPAEEQQSFAEMAEQDVAKRAAVAS